MNPIIALLITQILIPEVASLLRKNPGITDAEIIAQVGPLSDRIIAAGEAFLASKGVPPDAPQP